MLSRVFPFAVLMTASGLSTLTLPISANADDQLRKALIDNATPYINLRYRFEQVDQDGISQDAYASTLRTKLGYKTGKLHDTHAVLEVENVTVVGNDVYNDTLNGNTSRPVVADPASTEINQAYLAYEGIPDTTLMLGRKGVNLDNQRFVGTVGWRQNDQTYDMAGIVNHSLPDTELMYAFVDNVNRIFSDDHPLGNLGGETHLIHADYRGWKAGTLTGYGYLIDLEDMPVYGLSSKSFGLRFAGKTAVNDDVKALYAAEYAMQSDHGDNPTDYNADYYAVEGGVGWKGLTGKVGFESLGSDNGGTVSFQTPLATLHKFNGWADKFLTTPATGLEDLYGLVSYKVSGAGKAVDGTTFTLVYHDFSAESGGADYGTEWDVQIFKPICENYSVRLKYADYNADTFATDTQKLWMELGAKF